MKFGMPTLLELKTLEENVVLCKELNLDFIEINMNLPQFQIDKLSRERILEIQNENSIFFTFHLPEDLDICHFNKNIKKAYYEVISETIEFMKKINSPLLNMHMSKGIYFTLPSERVYLYNQYEDEYKKSINEFSSRMTDLISEDNIVFSIENTGIFDNKLVTDGLDMLLTNKIFSLTWDIGHDIASVDKDNFYMLNKKEFIKHIHIHDVKNGKDHSTLYDGNVDIDSYIKFARDKNLTSVIETKTIESLKTSVSRLQSKNIINKR